MRRITEAIIHCAATPPEWMADQDVGAKVREITKWHMDRGWRTIGYHYLIDRDGAIARGRPLEHVGAHVSGHNGHSVGICLVGGGGSHEDNLFSDHFTGAQDVALRGLLADLEAEHPIAKVSGHNEYSPKACPGFSVPDWQDAPQGLWARLLRWLGR